MVIVIVQRWKYVSVLLLTMPMYLLNFNLKDGGSAVDVVYGLPMDIVISVDPMVEEDLIQLREEYLE